MRGNILEKTVAPSRAIRITLHDEAQSRNRAVVASRDMQMNDDPSVAATARNCEWSWRSPTDI